MCNKQEICGKGLDKDHYRPVHDDEYIDNWSGPDKFDTLCESKFKVGLLGSMYFAGIVTTVLFIPILADNFWGRKLTLTITSFIIITALGGLLFCTNLYEAYVFMFLIGAAMPGKVFLALTYLLEFLNPDYHYTATFCYMITEPILLIMITFWYQFIDKSWFNLELIGFLLFILLATYYFIFVPESPKWLYTWLQFDKAREVLAYVAKFNLNDENKVNDIKSIKFDAEVKKEEMEMEKMGDD